MLEHNMDCISRFGMAGTRLGMSICVEKTTNRTLVESISIPNPFSIR
jgi:hypothetical protein